MTLPTPGGELAWPPPILHESIGSTSIEAARLAREGAPHGTVVCAREQTAGRGRLGRRWVSPPGNLYASFVLRPAIPAMRAAEIGFVAALAVADVVDSCLPGRARLKWPNDVLVNGAKISGILAERLGGEAAAVVLGIGINVAFAPGGLPYAATCLRSAGAAVTVEDTLAALCHALRRRVAEWERDGFAAIRAGWLARAHPPGTVLRVSLGLGVVECRFLGLDEDGALLAEDEHGPRRIVSGDVALAAA
ncbi:MAG TPA: biotin--[acetyl-CoA-carboxylase] ligase [Acetobacteraceae bacterium]